jgi:hypothetical protein
MRACPLEASVHLFPDGVHGGQRPGAGWASGAMAFPCRACARLDKGGVAAAARRLPEFLSGGVSAHGERRPRKSLVQVLGHWGNGRSSGRRVHFFCRWEQNVIFCHIRTGHVCQRGYGRLTDVMVSRIARLHPTAANVCIATILDSKSASAL